MSNKIILILLLIFSVELYAQEVAYVTDSLRLRLYTEANDSSDVLATLESGDSVEVLETLNRFSRVITYDGTEGWVKSAFLVSEPPAKLLYYSVSEQNKQLQEQIAELQNNTSTSASSTTNSEESSKLIAELQSALAKEQEAKQKLQTQIMNAEPSQVNLTSTSFGTNQLSTNAFSITENKLWVLVGISLLLIIGFILGMKFSNRRIRKRLHGFTLK